MDWAEIIVYAIVVVVAWGALLWLSGVWKRYEAARITVYDYEVGLKYREGRLTDVLPAGRYTTWPEPVSITRIDMREATANIAGQDILTADKLGVRASVVAVYKIVDARRYSIASSAAIGRLYQIVQVALRERVAVKALDDLLSDRNAVTDGLAEELSADVAALGLTLVSVKLLDLSLAGPAKQAFSDIWKAQKEGQAALERARGEQAALRALANAARILKGNPELMNLRVLQALAAAPGKAPPTIVLGGATGLLPVSGEPAADVPTTED